MRNTDKNYILLLGLLILSLNIVEKLITGGYLYSPLLAIEIFSIIYQTVQHSIVLNLSTLLIILLIGIYITRGHAKQNKRRKHLFLLISLGLLAVLLTYEIKPYNQLVYILVQMVFFYFSIGYIRYVNHHFSLNLNQNTLSAEKTRLKPILVDDSFSIEKRLKMPIRFSFKNEKEYINIRTPQKGIFTIGGGGSGKSVSIAENINWQMAMQWMCGIVYDFKDFELSNVVYTAYKHFNVKIKFKVVNFRYLNKSNRINPINPIYLENNLFVEQCVRTLFCNLNKHYIKDTGYFPTAAQNILKGLIIFLKNKKPEFCTLPHTITLVSRLNVDDLIAILKQDDEALIYVRQLSDALKKEAGQEASGVINSLRTELNKLYSKELFWVLTEDKTIGSEFNLALNDPSNPVLLCLVNHQPLADALAPIISLITSVCINLMNQKNRLPSCIQLDEGATIYIPNLDRLPATARSNKIILNYLTQDFSQIDKEYGKEVRRSIVSNLANQFYFRCADVETLKYISDAFGKQEKEYKGKSRNLSNKEGSSENISSRKENIIELNDLTAMSPGECVSMIADTKNNIVKGQITEASEDEMYAINDYKIEEIPEFTNVTEEMVKENFQQILRDVDSIKESFIDKSSFPDLEESETLEDVFNTKSKEENEFDAYQKDCMNLEDLHSSSEDIESDFNPEEN